MEESRKIKIIKWIGLILVLLFLIGLGYYIYKIYLHEDTNTQTSKTQSKTTAKKPSSSSDSTEAPKTIEECPSTLTAAENKLIKNWKTYNNTKYNYSFRYPADWTLQNTGANKYEIVSLVDENAFNPTMSANYQFRADTKVQEVDNSDYTIVEPAKSTKVDCVSAKYTVYYISGDFPGGRESRIIETTFTKNAKKFMPVFWFPPADPSDFADNYNLILKTIKFK